ncbi:MAG: PEGA domain-containing protein [bacterium]
MSHDIFISYSSPDQQTAVRICAALECEGIKCWIAPRDITPGVPWGEAIIDAINDARLFLLIFSAHANESPQVDREVERAVAKDTPLIPFRIGDIVPSKQLEYFLSAQHWLNASLPPTTEEVAFLVVTVKTLISKLDGGASRGESSPPPRPRPERRFGGSVDPAGGGGTGLAPKQPAWRKYLIRGLLPVVLVLAVLGVLKILSGGSDEPDLVAMGPTERTDPAVIVGAPQHGATDSLPGETDEPVSGRPAVVAPDRFGPVEIMTTPTGAAVIIDGQRVGSTPYRSHEVAVGEHRIQLRLTGYGEIDQTIQVHPERVEPLQVTLQPLTGLLTVTSTPRGATAVLDGGRRGITPCSFSGLEPGEHTLVISKSGYQSRRATVRIEPEQGESYHTDLVARTYDLTIKVEPSGEIFVNGDQKTENSSESYTASLSAGSYEIQARHRVWGRWTKTVQLGGADDVDLTFDFRRLFDYRITSNELYAKVFVNGEFQEQYTPCTLKLRPGDYRIEVVKDGYETVDGAREFTLESEPDEPLRFTLQKTQ